MAAKAITNVKPAQKIAYRPLKVIKRVLEFVGRPFYLLLSYFFIALVFVIYSPGHFLINSFRFLLVFIRKVRLPPIRIKISRRVSFFVILAFGIFIFWNFILKDLPSPRELTTRKQEVSTKIYDRNGVLLYKIYKDQNRTLVSLNQIPLITQQATLAAEDAEFYSHMGISIKGIMRSFVTNLKQGQISGGSTITQQLVKNALLTPEKTLPRKIKEMILAVETELTYTKPQILEMYMNEVAYGGTAYGIEEAAEEYFGKNAKDLDLAESALLAGLPKSPTNFSPFGVHPELAITRQAEVLHLMVVNKFITEAQADAAQKEKLAFVSNSTDIKAPHFVMYVKQALVDQFGEDMVQMGGLEVTTTLDYQIQTMAENAVANEISKLKSSHVGNGAALVIDPVKGDVLAMVGSKDYFDMAADGNVNVTTAPRQPGSSIKIINYAYALSHGYTPATILDDSPVSFSVPGSPPYSPVDYDGRYRGRITLRSALAESRNIPAVKVLASYGVDKMVDLGQKMGITTWDDPTRFGLSLTLGGGEVKLIDLAQVYATVANYGAKPDLKYISKITNYKGEVLENNQTLGGSQVIDSRVAYMLINILSDNIARTPAFGPNSALVIPGHPEVAVKTGTSNSFKDNLTFGFNQKYLVAVWVGNNDASPMSNIVSGVTGAAPIFNRIMTNLLTDQPSLAWSVPDGLVSKPICGGKSEWFLAESAPNIICEAVKPVEDKTKILPDAAHTQI
jgi:penicillin-binding protein 1C